MATDGSELNPTRNCARCGQKYQTSQALHRHLTSGQCPGKRPKGGIIIAHEHGESEIGPKSPREMWME